MVRNVLMPQFATDYCGPNLRIALMLMSALLGTWGPMWAFIVGSVFR